MLSLLRAYPEFKRAFDKRILSPEKNRRLDEVKGLQSHWHWFLKELRQLGLEAENKWPFTTMSNGYQSVRRYIERIKNENGNLAIKTMAPDIQRKLAAGDGVDRPVSGIFQRVEMDAHKLDGQFCVLMPTPDGDHLAKPVHRLWVIVIIDTISRAVLGYRLSMRLEVTSDDVLQAVKSALVRWHPRSLSFDGKYLEGAGLPSGISDDFLGVCWNETSVDGALAETCDRVKDVLRDLVGSTLITPATGFSARRTLDDRPFIERFFRNLASQGLHRMSNSTGSNPTALRGRDPTAVALASQFQIEYLEELLDVLIANYNATRHSSLGHRSPLEYLQFIVRQQGNSVLRYADEELVHKLLAYRKKCKVVGGLAAGRHPYVNFDNARYSNDVLAQRFDLVGKVIWVTNHYDEDARVALASTLDGQSLGVLRASPPWHRLPHSRRIRADICALLRAKRFQLGADNDAISAFVAYCHSQRNEKLPPHASYLELRRILANTADEHNSYDQRQTVAEQRDQEGNIPTATSIPSNSSMSSGILPPRRKAVC
jgi:transposase InsO family protein